MKRGKNSAHIGNDAISDTVSSPGCVSGPPPAVTALAPCQGSQGRKGQYRRLFWSGHICWHRLLLWAEPKGKAASNRRNRIPTCSYRLWLMLRLMKSSSKGRHRPNPCQTAQGRLVPSACGSK